MRTEIIGTPYLTQIELKEDERRELWSRLITTTPERFRQATETEIEEVEKRREEELKEIEQFNE